MEKKTFELTEKEAIELGNFLKEKRENLGYSTNYMNLLTGIDKGDISRIENGKKKKINPLHLKEIAIALKINQIDLFKKIGFIDHDAVTSYKSDILIKVPVMAVASAGTGQLNYQAAPIKHITIPKNGYNDRTYVIQVEGDSMEPVIKDGSYIVVDPDDTEIIDEKIYVVNYDGAIYIKRLVINNNIKAIILKSINPIYEDKYITEEMLPDFKVVGRAIEIIYKNKL
ncbi:hypothetical protein IX317_002130 [Fusobacterium sp. DD29]|uniref:XRE family transcriptional regulator n=1 Tax=unclassified Fusobacterium TaxID=2648384 RepID=UPI001B8BFF97|nr:MULTISPECIES: S24 family peptidase [unclassified Fusobacterium]MBR8750408.1 hypothetical protein [Fusobacterium sp. DD29]MBR8762649.1 hypothetical protein [Fusobacterium sp. DD25]MBR8768694.1 hypothetical protein [Fusobacterium sp. DD43]MBR8772767.1 hypothetical protein [Fusobacterium sp. DD40]MBR8776976.1 hypothetical protein [Fusobacterium sp. DD17]